MEGRSDDKGEGVTEGEKEGAREELEGCHFYGRQKQLLR